MSEVAHQTISACTLIMELKSQGFYRELSSLESSSNDSGVNTITENKQMVKLPVHA